MPQPDPVPHKILVVKLADLGDLLTATPALARLRAIAPQAAIHLLATGHSVPALQGTGLVDEVIIFDKFAFDRSSDLLLRPANLRNGLRLAGQLRRQRYDAVILLHHLTTRFGALKYAALAWASGAPLRIGLDNGRGGFLTRRAVDKGFGAQHEAAYWLDVVDLVDEGVGERNAHSAAVTGPHPKSLALGERDFKTQVPPLSQRERGTRPQVAWGEGQNHVANGITGGVGATSRSPLQYPLRVGISDDDRAWAAEHLPAAVGPRIALHPGSGGFAPARRWSPERFAQVGDALQAQLGAQIILVGGPNDDTGVVGAAMQQAPLNLAGQTTLGQLGAILASCDLFIGADSGVMHLATAAGVRVLALFGPSNADAWGPWAAPDRAAILRSAPPCSPCSYVLNTVGQREGCPARTCMGMITVEGVVAAAQALLAGEPVRARQASPRPIPMYQPRVPILGVPIDPLTYDDLRAYLAACIADNSGRARQVITVNTEFIMIAQRDIHTYLVLNRADLCTADGQGLLWAARRLGHPLPERITGSDGLPQIAGWAAEAGWRLFLLGAGEGVAVRAADALRARHPGLKIVGTYSGSPAPEDEDALVARVNASGADLLFVAYGVPTEEKWIARNLPRLRVKAAIGVGGAIDFVAGEAQRAPVGWQRLGLEWFYRLLREPWRWRRMTRLPRFVLAVLRRGSRGPGRFVLPGRQ